MGVLSNQKFDQTKYDQVKYNMLKNIRKLVDRYGPDAEKIVHGRALKTALNSKNMKENKIREMIEDALKNPKKADLNKDGKLSNYEKKRGAAIEKAMKKQDLEENEFGGMGLIVRGKTPKDNDLIDQAVEESGFYGVYNEIEDYWFFPEEGDQSTMDQLENELETIFIKKGADVSYEGQFNESKKADLNKDGKLSNYEKKHSAAIKKAMVKENKGQNKAKEIVKYLREKIFPKLTDEELEEFRKELALALDLTLNESKNSKHTVKYSKSNNTYQVWLGDKLVTDFAEKENAEKEAKRLDRAQMNEDIDLGHQDNEPGMLKADLYKIGKYAMELYQMMDSLEGMGEVDFPHWWQSKIVRATSMISSAKHYLEFELKEPQVDAMVDVASEEDVIDEKLTAKTPMKKYIKDFAKSDAPQFKGKSKEKKRQMAVAAKLSAENPNEGLAEIILNKLKNR